jgi:hypothetical protein
MVDLRQPSGSLHSGSNSFPHTTNGAAPSEIPVLVNEPRLLGESDIPWLIYLCKKRYAARYDQFGTEGWFKNTVLKQPGIFLPIRTDNAFSIALISFIPWTPVEIECNMCFICADDNCMWEALKLLRVTIDWARMRKCKRWRMCSDTEYDFSALARRLGANEISPRYTVEF